MIWIKLNFQLNIPPCQEILPLTLEFDKTITIDEILNSTPKELNMHIYCPSLKSALYGLTIRAGTFMPPIINGDHTKVTENKNLFIDITGTHRKSTISLNILLMGLLLGREIYTL